MAQLNQYLAKVINDGGSDLFIAAGAPVSEKIGTDVEPITGERLDAHTAHNLVCQIYSEAGRDMTKANSLGDDDFSFAVAGLARFRVNVYKQRGSMAAVLRAVSFEIPDYKKLGIPEQIVRLGDVQSGMVIVTGTAGSGKSTTQACIIDRINHTKKRHIVTLEDPIEYLHRNNLSIVSQREMALDTEGYATALRACLRQAPDVIYLGEMRDAETIRTAMTAAETGHLVLGTLHTKGAANTVDRIIDAFPADQQGQVRTQLAMVLDTVVFQQLVPAKPHPIAAFEVMRMTPNVRGLIRDGKTHQLDAAIASGAKDGMISMDKALADLIKSGRIQAAEAEHLASNAEQMKRLAGISQVKGFL